MMARRGERHRKLATRMAAVVMTAGVVGSVAPWGTASASAHHMVTVQGMPTSLVIGTRGAAVEQLQKALISEGVTVRGGADGIFGPATQEAVRSYQRDHGLEANGVADTSTLMSLGLLTTPIQAVTPTAVARRGASGAPESLPSPVAPVVTTPEVAAAPLASPVRIGDRGDLVRTVQQAMTDAGITVRGGVDGVFGAGTQAAVRDFQRRAGLPVTGEVDADTYAALITASGSGSSGDHADEVDGVDSEAPANSAPVSIVVARGDRSADVTRVQEALIFAGVTVPGGADGVFGSATQNAVRQFQTNRGLPITGVVDTRTWEALGLHIDDATTRPGISVFPMAGPCYYIDTWGAPRSGGRRHEGVDIIGASGLEIYAVADGTITRVYQDRPGTLAGNGLRLTMADGTYFFYAHLSAFAEGIEVGAEVVAGQVIGYNGSTGNSSTPHLHFEVHPGGGAAINPYPIVRAVDGCD